MSASSDLDWIVGKLLIGSTEDRFDSRHLEERVASLSKPFL